tara:strand:- start:31 stop:453 length:423 start_codon:yes stop_codon:yes gene_type:complete
VLHPHQLEEFQTFFKEKVCLACIVSADAYNFAMLGDDGTIVAGLVLSFFKHGIGKVICSIGWLGSTVAGSGSMLIGILNKWAAGAKGRRLHVQSDNRAGAKAFWAAKMRGTNEACMLTLAMQSASPDHYALHKNCTDMCT